MAHITVPSVSNGAAQHPELPPPGHQLSRHPDAQQPAPRSTTAAPTRHVAVAELAGLRDLGPAPARGRAGTGPSAANPAEPTDFGALPGALHESIAMRLAPRDLAMLAGTNRHLRGTLRPMSISHRIVAQAAGTHDVAARQSFLQATLALEDYPALPVAARAALAAWIEHLPSMQLDAFRASLQTCASMQPAAQAAALTALGPPLAQLPADKRDEACRHLLDAIGTLPVRYGMEPFRGVATQLATLAVVKRETTFEAVLQLAVQATPGLQGAVLEALTGQIRHLPTETRQRNFQRLLNAAADDQLARMVAQLSPVVARLSRGSRAAAFQDLRRCTARIAPGKRGAVLEGLANLVAVLPRGARKAATQDLRHLAESFVPTPHDWRVPAAPVSSSHV